MFMTGRTSTMPSRSRIGTPFRQLGGACQILRLDERIAADEIFRFSERAVGHRAAFVANHLAFGFEGLAAIFEVTACRQIFEPVHPLLHDLLGLFRRRASLAAAVEIEKLRHVCLLFVFGLMHRRRSRQRLPDIFRRGFTRRSGDGRRSGPSSGRRATSRDRPDRPEEYESGAGADARQCARGRCGRCRARPRRSHSGRLA